MTVGVTYERSERSRELERMAAKAGLSITIARERWTVEQYGREHAERGPVVALGPDGTRAEELGADYTAARGTLRTRIARVKARAERERRAA